MKVNYESSVNTFDHFQYTFWVSDTLGSGVLVQSTSSGRLSFAVFQVYNRFFTMGRS